MANLTAQGAMNSTTSVYVTEEMQYQVSHFILLAVFSGFATTAVVLRFWARRMQTQALAPHDYLIMLGLVSILVASQAKPQFLMHDNRSLH